MPPTVRAIVFALCAVAGACEGASGSDAGVPDAGSSIPAAVAPPTGVTVLSPACPAGWTEAPIAPGGIGEGHTCAPWVTAPTCGPGELLSPGTGCVPLADDCATDAPPELDATMAFVVPGAPEGGDGSRASPYATIGAAWRAGHARIALAPGDHVLDGARYDDLTLIGTCPTLTAVEIPSFVSLRGTSTMRRLRIDHGGLVVLRGSSLSLEAVELVTMDRAVEVSGTLVARRVAVRDASEIGVLGLNPDAITLEDVSMERVPIGLWVGAPSSEPPYAPHATVRLTRVAAVDVTEAAFQAAALTALELTEVAVERAQAGLLTNGVAVDLHDGYFRDLEQVGVGAIGAGHTQVARVQIADASTGVLLEGGTFAVSDLALVRAGLSFTSLSASGTADRVVAVDATTYGVELTGAGQVTLRDVVVDGVTSTSGDTGSALAVTASTDVTLERAHFGHVQHVAVGVVSATLRLSDLRIEDVAPISDEDGGGLLVIEGATLEVHRAVIERAFGVAVRVEGANARLEDLAVASIAASGAGFGIGLYVTSTRGGLEPASLTLTRVSVLDTRRVGVLAAGTATLTATDLQIDGTLASSNAGIALAVIEGASARVERFVLRRAELSGALVADEVDVELRLGRIESSLFGMLADPALSFNGAARPGFALRDVVFSDNEVDHHPSRLSLGLPAAIAF